MARPGWISMLVLLGGCVGSPGYPPSNDGGSSTSTSTSNSTSNSNSTSGISMTSSPDTSGSTTRTSSSDSSTTSSPPDPFEFDDNDPDDYIQIDRAGFPAVNTALNLLGDKDAYNAATPADDANLMFAGEFLESLETLHLGAPGAQTPDNTGLDDDLLALGFAPCVTPPMPMSDCDDQAGPFTIPDVMELNLDQPAGFPNGRMLEDPVMDLLLAIYLLDLQTHSVTAFVDIFQDGTFFSLNPVANDVEFGNDFPYLAPAHAM